MFADNTSKLQDQAARLRAEAEKLEKELAAVAASRPKPVASTAAAPAAAPVTPTRALTFQQLSDEISKALSGSTVLDASLKTLKEAGTISKFDSASAKGFRRYSADAFQSQTGILPQELESGGTQDDLKVALAVVLAASTLAVLGGITVGGFVGTFLVYIFLLIPILFIGIGSSSPGLISVFIVLVNNLIDGKSKERKVTHEAARFLTGYLLGLPIEKVIEDAPETTVVKFYDTWDGNISDLGASSGPDPRKKFVQEDILPQSVLAISGSVAERMEYGKVIDKQGDFLYLVALMDLVRPAMKAGQKNDHVIYSALQAHKLLTSNKSKLERLKEKMAAKAPLAELVATIEA